MGASVRSTRLEDHTRGPQRALRLRDFALEFAFAMALGVVFLNLSRTYNVDVFGFLGDLGQLFLERTPQAVLLENGDLAGLRQLLPGLRS